MAHLPSGTSTAIDSWCERTALAPSAGGARNAACPCWSPSLERQRAFARPRPVLYHGRPATQTVAEADVALTRPAYRNRGGRRTVIPGRPLPLRLVVSQVRDAPDVAGAVVSADQPAGRRGGGADRFVVLLAMADRELFQAAQGGGPAGGGVAASAEALAQAAGGGEQGQGGGGASQGRQHPVQVVVRGTGGGRAGAVDGRGRAKPQFQRGQGIAVVGIDQQGGSQFVAAVGTLAEHHLIGLTRVPMVVQDRPVMDDQGVFGRGIGRAHRPAACNGSTRAGRAVASLAKKRQAAWVLAKAAVRRGRAAGPAASAAHCGGVRSQVGHSGAGAAVQALAQETHSLIVRSCTCVDTNGFHPWLWTVAPPGLKKDCQKQRIRFPATFDGPRCSM